MTVTGIVCEYNPFHRGHRKQIEYLRRKFPEGATVCLMSGNFVQRGEPAIFDKSLRAREALEAGADLVLELPATVSLRSAEGFARGAVEILAPFCTHLCFGAESGDAGGLMDTARTLLDPAFPAALREQLDRGLSFPAARQAALGEAGGLVQSPNDILGVEYCKAILQLGAALEPVVLRREGDYHATALDGENPSATALRRAYLEGALPSPAPVHSLQHGQSAILARLRAMEEADFEALPYGSEGLWRKLRRAVRQEATLEGIFAAVKSKRYTHTRIARMVLCGYLGITGALLEQRPPYVRVLGFSQRGREALKLARQTGLFPNAGEPTDGPWQRREALWGDLWTLCGQVPEAPGAEARRRVAVLE